MSDDDHQNARFEADCGYGYHSAGQRSGFTDDRQRALLSYNLNDPCDQDNLGLDRFRSPDGRRGLDAQLLAGDIPDDPTCIPLEADQYSEIFGHSGSRHGSPPGAHWNQSEADLLIGRPDGHYGPAVMPGYPPLPETLDPRNGVQQTSQAHPARYLPPGYVESQDVVPPGRVGTNHQPGLRGYQYYCEDETNHATYPRFRLFPEGKASSSLPASSFHGYHHPSGPASGVDLDLSGALSGSGQPDSLLASQRLGVERTAGDDRLLAQGLDRLAIQNRYLSHQPQWLGDPRERGYYHSQNTYPEPSPAGEENLLADIEGEGTFVSSMNAYPAPKACQYPSRPYPHPGPPVHPAFAATDPYDSYLHPTRSRYRLPPISLPTPDPSARSHRRYPSDVNPYHMHSSEHHPSATQAPSQPKPARDDDAFYRWISDLLADEPDLHRLLVEEIDSILSSDPFSNSIGIDFGFGAMGSLNGYGLQKSDLRYTDAFCIDALYLFEQALRHDSLLTEKERLRRWGQRLNWENVPDGKKKEHWFNMLPLDQPRIGVGPGGWWAYWLHNMPLDYSCGYYRSLVGKTGMFASTRGAFRKGAFEAHYPLTGNLKSRYPMWRDGGLGLGRSLIHWLDGRPPLATPGASQHEPALADANAAQAQAKQSDDLRRTREEGINRKLLGQSKIASLLAAIRAETSISLPPDMNPALRPRTAPQSRINPPLSTQYHENRPLLNSSGYLDPGGNLNPGPYPGHQPYSFPHLKVQFADPLLSWAPSRPVNQGSFHTPYLNGSDWGRPPSALKKHRTGDAQNPTQAATGSSGGGQRSSARISARKPEPDAPVRDPERHLRASDSDSTRPLPGSANSKIGASKDLQPPVRPQRLGSREYQVHPTAMNVSGREGSQSHASSRRAGLPEPPKMVIPSHMIGRTTRLPESSIRSTLTNSSHRCPPTNVDT